MYTSAGVSTENAIEGATFIDAKPVYYPPMVYEWGNDHLGGVAWKTAVFHDKDGSVSGVADSYILINDGVYDSIASDEEACEIRPTWNAAVCTGDVGRLNIGGAGGGGFGGGAQAEPVVLSRNGRDFPVTRNQSNVRAGTEIKVTTARPDVSLSLREMDQGSWVIFELPGFTTAASGTEQSSLDALRAASDTSYFKDNDALWVKVVSNGESARGVSGRGARGTSIQVSR
jgi:cell migration-inducing and hyaluronan-binding protein